MQIATSMSHRICQVVGLLAGCIAQPLAAQTPLIVSTDFEGG
jgi:hypothetical protein